MNQIIKSAKGVISIFVALMMTGILSLGTFVLEAGRLQVAKTQLSEATISASTSMLSSYNTELYDRYGVLAIDSQRSNAISCRNYLDFNSDLAVGYYGNNVTRLYKIEDVKMTGVYNLTYPHILKRQLLTVAKYNLVPEDSQFNMYTASYVLDELQMKCQYVSAELQDIIDSNGTGDISGVSAAHQTALAILKSTYTTLAKYSDKHNVTLTTDTYNLLPSSIGPDESDIPVEDIDNISAVLNDAASLLGISASTLDSDSIEVNEITDTISLDVLPMYEGANLSDISKLKELAYKSKILVDRVNSMIENLRTDMDGNLLLNSYISQSFSNRNYTDDKYVGPGIETTEESKENMTFAAACCEYIFAGYSCETDNQSRAYDYIMSLRLIGNIYSVFTKSSSFEKTNAYSTMAHLLWAYYETCVDTELLTNHNTKVPLSKDNMLLDINNPSAVAAAFASKNTTNALRNMGYYNETLNNFVISGMDFFDYTDSLSLALWFVPNSQKLLRVADLMQLEMRYKQQYVENIPATFLMSEQNTYCRVECNAKMNSILPIVSIGGADHSLQGQSLRSVKYAGY